MLDHIIQTQAARVEALAALKRTGRFPPPLSGKRPSFAAALRKRHPCAIIAEYKRASPTAGEINMWLSPEDAAAMFAAAGAAALSVLTEERCFRGSTAYLERMTGAGLPLLRKDFLVHPLQVEETAATPAAALLLIVRSLPDDTLPAMLAAAASVGLECVLEIFNASDLTRARRCLDAGGTHPVIIQVNTRDLQSMRVDAAASETLIAQRREGELWISASGAARRQDVEKRAVLGYDAVLIGTALMAAPDPGAALAGLLPPSATQVKENK
ncbi:MAG: indole-3-glycerol-phosphate synthase [Desulfovibrio sp.]|jgi:indole-3-glycerol phosphate synthase|nr:indole-3-glycerol-phosphate synthase [Desulfovibrio sp.]